MNISKKRMCFEPVSKEKAFPVQCRTKQTKVQGSLFFNGRLLHPPSLVLPNCLRIAPARPTKILKTTTFTKKEFGF